MTFGLAAGQLIALKAATANVVNYAVSGMDTTTGGVNTPQLFTQGQLASTSVTSVYSPAASHEATITEIELFNTSGSTVVVGIYKNGTAASNQVRSITLPINGSAHYGGGVWQLFDATGTLITTTSGSSVTSLAAADSSMVIAPSTGAVLSSRGHITGDVDVPAGSNASAVNKIQGVAVSGTPALNYMLLASGSSAAAWAPIPSMPPGPVFNLLAYGATGNGTTDDTAAILACIAAAGTTGVIYAPPGVYAISQVIQFAGLANVFGGGGGWNDKAGGLLGHANPATVFLCLNSTSGLWLNGDSAIYRDFMVDGNSVSPIPIQRGANPSGGANAGSYGTFVNVWARLSTGVGWQILASQNDVFFHCGSFQNAGAGLFLSGGTGGHDFYHFYIGYAAGGALKMDHSVSGGPYSIGPSNTRFWGGLWEPTIGNPASVIFMRDCQQVSFQDISIDSGGATVCGLDIDNSCTWITIRVQFDGGSTGTAIQYAGTAVGAVDSCYINTDGCTFIRLTYAVGFVAPASSLPLAFSGFGWMDNSFQGVNTASGLQDGDSIIKGRNGKWNALNGGTFSGAGWYRMGMDGRVQLKGSGSCTSGGATFILPAGYFNPSVGITVLVPVTAPTPALAELVISNTGTTTITQIGGSGSINFALDGISFAIA